MPQYGSNFIKNRENILLSKTDTFISQRVIFSGSMSNTFAASLDNSKPGCPYCMKLEVLPLIVTNASLLLQVTSTFDLAGR